MLALGDSEPSHLLLSPWQAYFQLHDSGGEEESGGISSLWERWLLGNPGFRLRLNPKSWELHFIGLGETSKAPLPTQQSLALGMITLKS